MKAGVFCFITEVLMNKVLATTLSASKIVFRRHFSCYSLLLIGALLFTCLVSPTFGQTEDPNTAVVINALTFPDLGITASVSLINLAESNERRAVDNEILPIGFDPILRRRAIGLSIYGHLAYITSFNLPVAGGTSSGDNIYIINLEDREFVGEIPIQAGTTPQQIALVSDQKLYVTCAASHEVHVVDIDNRNVTKVLTGSFNKPTGITLLNGKAYVTNPAWEWDPVARKTIYYDSSVTVIDTETDIILKSIPVPTNPSGILNDGDSTVIVKTTGNYNDILGNIVLIDANTDAVVETVKLKLTPGSFALNSEKRLFIQGSWQNPGLLIYDTAARDWIRDKDNTIANFSNDADTSISGGLAFAPDGNLYITQPDWSGGGQDFVRVMDVTDASLLRSYRVGPGANNVGFATITPRREDINNDGFVNVKDMIIASRFLGDEGAGIIADVNGDEMVDIRDLVLIGHGR